MMCDFQHGILNILGWIALAGTPKLQGNSQALGFRDFGLLSPSEHSMAEQEAPLTSRWTEATELGRLASSSIGV